MRAPTSHAPGPAPLHDALAAQPAPLAPGPFLAVRGVGLGVRPDADLGAGLGSSRLAMRLAGAYIERGQASWCLPVAPSVAQGAPPEASRLFHPVLRVVASGPGFVSVAAQGHVYAHAQGHAHAAGAPLQPRRPALPAPAAPAAARAAAPLRAVPPTPTLLVDDSPSFLQSAARFLASDERIEVVGVAMSARQALDEVKRLKPALVLMDLTMPGMSGLEATRLLKALPNPPRIVILTLYDTQEYRHAALQAQADGFVAKSDLGENLVPLLESLLAVSVPAAEPIPSPAVAPASDATAANPSVLDDAGCEDRSAVGGPSPAPSVAPSVAPGETVGEAVGEAVGLWAPQASQAPQIQVLGPGVRAPGRAPLASAPWERRRVLLGEDRPSVSHLMALDMWRAGIETRIAVDALSALELFESFGPHLVLLDATSPRMRAALVCRSIRERSGVPILLVTTPDAPPDALPNSRPAESAAHLAVPLAVPLDVQQLSWRPEDVAVLTDHVLSLLGSSRL